MAAALSVFAARNVATADDFTSFVAPATSTQRTIRPPETNNLCNLELRVIEGRSRAGKFSQADLVAGPLLSDLREQLQPLPFKYFRVVDVVRRTVPLNEQGIFSVGGVQDQAYKLSVTPQHTQDKRVQMTVHWTGPSGETLVATSLHAPMGKYVVLGTDSPRDASTIMCLKAQCQ